MALRRRAVRSSRKSQGTNWRTTTRGRAQPSRDALAALELDGKGLTHDGALDLQHLGGNRATTAVVAAAGTEPAGIIQRLNKKEKKKFKDWVEENLPKVKSDLNLGDKRNEKAQTGNYWYLKNYLSDLGLGTVAKHVNDAAAVVREVTGRSLEIKEQAAKIDAAKVRDAALNEASDVSIEYGDEDQGTKVEVYLDNDQLKHQPPSEPIGTRQKGGGNKFKSTYATKDWHKANTLVHMRDWARDLTGIAEGVKIYHGQARPVDEIHYEGYCLLAEGVKYVLFHCYPANGSKRKL